MTKVKKEQIVLFDMVASNIISKSDGKMSKFLYALSKMQKRLKSEVESYNDSLEEIKINLAGKDKDGYLITENNSYKFTPENRIKLNKETKELSKEEIEVEPYIVSDEDCPKLDFYTKEALTPFVFLEEE